MGFLSHQIHEAKVAGAGFVLALAGAVVGVVWATIWLDRLLSLWLGPQWAPLIIALAALAPILVMTVFNKKHKEEEKTPVQGILHTVDDQLTELTRTAEGLVEKAPLMAIAVAALAGLLAARFPSALSLLVQIVSRHRGAAST